MTDYSKLNYWEERYSNTPDPFDWYQIYENLRDKIAQFIKPSDKILIVGAGNSTLSENLYEEGFTQITNIDYSSNVVKLMSERYKERGFNIEYLEMNVLDMKNFKNGEFNVVIDKGTLDSILCGENSIPLIDKMMKEIHRVLAPEGIYLCISYGDEDHRKTFFINHGWEVSLDTVPKSTKDIEVNVDSAVKDPKNYHYIYRMLKSS